MFKKINITKEYIKKYLNLFLIIFLILQPLFDLKIFYNSISTLVRVIIIGILFLIYFCLNSNSKKYWLFLYPVIIFTYFIFHHINALNFNSLVPGNFNYSIFSEFLYFVKMLTPFLLVFVLYESNLNTQYFIKIIKYIVLIMGLTIIISNVFCFSYGSYNDEIIKANFFSWFNNSNNYTYQELASKGLFEYANQISAILLMFLPLCLISFVNQRKFSNFFVLLINILPLFLLGTKVAVLGIFIVFIYAIIIYIFKNKFLNKQKLSFKSLLIILLIIVCYSLILPYNPTFMRIDETKTIQTSSTIEQPKNNTNIESESSQPSPYDPLTYVEENYKEKQIKQEFITISYPYTYDTEFWLKIFDEPLSNRVNYRFIEQAMIERVVEINNNSSDKYLGISHTRIQNIFNIERDFVEQYYALGIIGLVLIFIPYFILLFIYLYKILKTKLRYFSVINALSFVTILMVFAISYFSGNLLNSLSFTIYFAILFALLFNSDTDNKL